MSISIRKMVRDAEVDLDYMRNKILTRMGVGLVLAALLMSGCGKSSESKPPAPHSTDAVMEALVVHADRLTEAAKRQDFKYVHDYAFYLKKLVQAFYSKLEPAQQEQFKGLSAEIVTVSNQLDAASRKKDEAATLAGTQRLQEIMKGMNAQLKGSKST